MAMDDMTPVVSGAPETIYLCYGDLDHDDTHAALYGAGDVLWCPDQQGDSDVRYVRADLVLAAMPDNWQEDPETKALGMALGLQATPSDQMGLW